MSAQLLADELSKAFHGEWADKKIPEFARLEPIVQRVVAALRAQGEPVAYMYEHEGMDHSGEYPPGFVLANHRWSNAGTAWHETPLYAAPPTERAK